MIDGLEYIEQSKLNGHKLKIKRNVVVIKAGNTRDDCATIVNERGAEHVTMLYRRTASEMTAYPHEYDSHQVSEGSTGLSFWPNWRWGSAWKSNVEGVDA